MTYEEVFTQIKSIFMEADVSGEKGMWHSSLMSQEKGKEHFTQK